MSNSYKYIDPDYTYTDPNTGILRNLHDITDTEVLLFVESSAVTKRLQELYEKPIKIKGIDSLFEIHKHLFQDIFVWAGKKRIVEISKDGKQFFSTTYFHNIILNILHFATRTHEKNIQNPCCITPYCCCNMWLLFPDRQNILYKMGDF
jgi:fido (protein-threonine AMPylation protein)